MWNYGDSYQPVRHGERYRAGQLCKSMEALNPPIDSVVSRILANRGADGVDGILLKVEDGSSSSDSNSDYSPIQQRRRVQQRQTSVRIDDLVN